MNKKSHISKEGKLGHEIYVEDTEAGGYTTFFSEFPEIISEGETVEEAQKNLWNTLFDVLTHLLKKR
jgi:predicted RNase H-like HicB family nuclease